MVFLTASLKTNVSSTDIIIVLNSALSVLGKVYIYLLKFPFTHVSLTLLCSHTKMFKRRKMTREIVTKHVLLCFYKTNLYLRLRLYDCGNHKSELGQRWEV